MGDFNPNGGSYFDPDAGRAESTDYGYGDSNLDYGYGDDNHKTDYGYGDDNHKTDYGYGDSTDYGYGGDLDPNAGGRGGDPDYGYGGGAADYGYGDPDYGYGDTNTQDYGYGGDFDPNAPRDNDVLHAKKASDDYGYGDDYGYVDPAEAIQPREEKKRPKRRCSVTRYSIEAEACDKPLDYHWEGQDPNTAPSPPEVAPAPAPEPKRVTPRVLEPVPAADDKSTAATEATAGNSSDGTNPDGDEGDSMLAKVKLSQLNLPKKKTMLGRIRKRLSII